MSSQMERLSTYISTALDHPLPPEVAEKTKHHVLDTLAAMVSGSRLKPGTMATRFVRSQGGTPEALVVGSDLMTTAVNAAMANAMLAHADETDDSHAPSLTHPGCAIVPAALAVAERENAGGEALLRAVALGYDVGCRIGRAMGPRTERVRGHATHSIGPMFGAAAAAAGLTRLDPRGVRYCLAYVAQQASGITSWARDSEHVERPSSLAAWAPEMASRRPSSSRQVSPARRTYSVATPTFWRCSAPCWMRFPSGWITSGRISR